MTKARFLGLILISLILLIGTAQPIMAFKGNSEKGSGPTDVVSSEIDTATQLAFIHQPTDTVLAACISPAVMVAVEDADGNTVTSSTVAITVVISDNPSGGGLGGTTRVDAVNGVATFTNLNIDKLGTGYTLRASTSCGMKATSNPFNIVVGTPAGTEAPVLMQITVTGLIVNSPPALIDEGGYIHGNYELTSTDGTVTLDLPEYNGCWDTEGHALTNINATVPASPNSSGDDNTVVLVYTFGPDGALFNPPLTLTLKYDPVISTAGVLEDSLYAAGWDGAKWQRLSSVIDTMQKTITIQISHFSTYAIIGKVLPLLPAVVNTVPPTADVVTPIASSIPIATTTPVSATAPAVIGSPTTAITTTQAVPPPSIPNTIPIAPNTTVLDNPQSSNTPVWLVLIGIGAGILFIFCFIVMMVRHRGTRKKGI